MHLTNCFSIKEADLLLDLTVRSTGYISNNCVDF